MFGEARPARFLRQIWVAASKPGSTQCARCSEECTMRDVAIFTRTRPGDPFDPWCHHCALLLVRWAGIGALEVGAMDNEAAASSLREALNDGLF